MTDQELLEMAAKAVGIRGRFTENNPEDGAPCYSSGINVGHRVQILWNPLTDDGDALRLAVKLEMQLRLRHSENEISIYGAPEGRIDEIVGDDPFSATRRAIVRVAAEIGKSMEKSQ